MIRSKVKYDSMVAPIVAQAEFEAERGAPEASAMLADNLLIRNKQRHLPQRRLSPVGQPSRAPISRPTDHSIMSGLSWRRKWRAALACDAEGRAARGGSARTKGGGGRLQLAIMGRAGGQVSGRPIVFAFPMRLSPLIVQSTRRANLNDARQKGSNAQTR